MNDDQETKYQVENVEFQISSEHITLGKKLFSILTETTHLLLESGKNISRKFLQKTYYTHTIALFYLEGTFLKYLGLMIKNVPVSSLGKVVTKMGTLSIIEDAKYMKQRIDVGDHMTIKIRKYRDFSGKVLEDGTTINPGDTIGVIDFYRNIPKLQEDDNLVGFVKRGIQSAQISLEELAQLCEEQEPRLDGIEVFYGVSHLAGPLAKRLGFDVLDISDPLKRAGIKFTGKSIAWGVAGDNKEWQKYRANFKAPKEAFISRDTLVRLYGPVQEDVSAERNRF